MFKRGSIFLFFLLVSVGLPVLLVNVINGLFWIVSLIIIIFCISIIKGNKFLKNKAPKGLNLDVLYVNIGLLSLLFAVIVAFIYENMYYKHSLNKAHLSQISTALPKDNFYFTIRDGSMDLASILFTVAEGETTREKKDGNKKYEKYYYTEGACHLKFQDSTILPGVKLWVFHTDYDRTGYKFRQYCKELRDSTFIISTKNSADFKTQVGVKSIPGVKDIIIETVDVVINHSLYYVLFTLLFVSYAFFCFLLYRRNPQMVNKRG